MNFIGREALLASMLLGASGGLPTGFPEQPGEVSVLITAGTLNTLVEALLGLSRFSTDVFFLQPLKTSLCLQMSNT